MSNRREFLKGAAAGAFGVMGAGFAGSASAAAVKFDKEADVIVVGLGGKEAFWCNEGRGSCQRLLHQK